MKKIAAFILTVVLGMTVGANAQALSTWRTIGYSRDNGPYPIVGIYGGTVNPEYMRVILDDHGFGGGSSVSVSISCHDPHWNTWGRSISQTLWLPKTLAWDIPTSMTYCSFGLFASNTDTLPRLLTAYVQAAY